MERNELKLMNSLLNPVMAVQNKDILLVFGEGGHREQMMRLVKLLELDRVSCAAIVDRTGISDDLASKELVAKPMRVKESTTRLKATSLALRSTLRLIYLAATTECRVMLSTGPGIAVIPAVVFRLMGRKVVYLETWSRFSTRSTTGRCMYRISNLFYVQNEALLNLFPKAVYSGRL
jgi:beta-1,4-N-acetylglucosaminyltransferase